VSAVIREFVLHGGGRIALEDEAPLPRKGELVALFTAFQGTYRVSEVTHVIAEENVRIEVRLS